MGKTVAERKRDERERKAKAGLQRYEVWLRPSEWKRVQREIAKNRKPVKEVT